MSKKFKKPQPVSGPLTNRSCLKCGSTFKSSGPGNRVCEPCKSRIEWTEALGDFSIGFPDIARAKRGR